MAVTVKHFHYSNNGISIDHATTVSYDGDVDIAEQLQGTTFTATVSETVDLSFELSFNASTLGA